MNGRNRGRRILLVLGEPTNAALMKTLEAEGYFVYDYSDALKARAHIFNEPPDIIILSDKASGWRDFITQMKDDSVFGHLPIIFLIGEKGISVLQSLADIPVDDFLFESDDEALLLLRLHIRLSHARRDLDANPLTRLPGNYSILAAIQVRIDQGRSFALCYADLDNFKAFNDRYGFARGDDAIRMTARVLTNVVRRACPKESFIGHLGGDDFVFIINPEKIHECCEQVLQNFNIIAPTLFADEDRVQGYFDSQNRRGEMQRIPLLSLSIAVIDSTLTDIHHPGEAAAVAGELKKEVKKMDGSNYLVNRRA